MSNFPQLDVPNALSSVPEFTVKITGATAASSFYIPANTQLKEIILNETAGNAVTGGLKFGTTSGGTDIVAAQAVGASAFTFVTQATLLKQTFSVSATQKIFFDAVASWNSAAVNITAIYRQF